MRGIAAGFRRLTRFVDFQQHAHGDAARHGPARDFLRQVKGINRFDGVDDRQHFADLIALQLADQMERNMLTRNSGSAGIVGNAQRESALPATCHQSFGLRHHFLRTILADHTHASVDRSHDLTHVARFRGGKQAYGTCVTPGMLLRRCDAVQHTVHAIGDLHGTHTVDHLIGKILMVHICSHVQPLAFNPNYLYQSKKKPVRRSEVKR